MLTTDPVAVVALEVSVVAPVVVAVSVAAPEVVVASEVAVSVVAPEVVASEVAVSVVAPAVVVASEAAVSAAAPAVVSEVVPEVVSAVVALLVVSEAAVVVVAPLWYKNTFMFMYPHQSPRNLVPVPTSLLANLKSTTKSSSLRLHLLLPTKLPSFQYNLKTKKRLWSTFWSRNPKINKILLFPLLLPLNPPNQKFTSSNTRPKRMAAVAVLVLAVLVAVLAVLVVDPVVALEAVLAVVLVVVLVEVLAVVLAVVAAAVAVMIWVVVPVVAVVVLLPPTMAHLANLDLIKSSTNDFGKNALLTLDLCLRTQIYATG